MANVEIDGYELVVDASGPAGADDWLEAWTKTNVEASGPAGNPATVEPAFQWYGGISGK